jgi:hypothetical protein
MHDLQHALFCYAYCFLSAAICAELSYPLSAHDADTSSFGEYDAHHREFSQATVDLQAFPPMSEFDVITTRPLFFHSRRPPSTDTSYRLRGILLSGHRRVAILEGRSDGALARFYEGDLVGDWQILSIEAGSVTLTNAECSYTMTIAKVREELIRNHDSMNVYEIDPEDTYHDGQVEDEEMSQDLHSEPEPF